MKIIVYLASIISIISLANEAGRRVSWIPASSEGNFVFARLLNDTAALRSRITGTDMEFTSATCEGKFLRPFVDKGPLTSAENEILCRVKSSSEASSETQIRWDLSQAEIIRWGNRFFPKGIALNNTDSEALFVSMQSAYDRKDSNLFKRTENAFASPGFIYHYIEYSLATDAKGEGPKLYCSEEYFYSPGAKRPERPEYTRCDFIHQWKHDGIVD